jgi:protein-tyrosine phosphatase
VIAALRLCFVCSGNICRSPTAEVVMQRLIDDAGLSSQVAVDSAGTGRWHLGELADVRTREAASRRGLRMPHRARQFVAADLHAFELVLAMDGSHVLQLHELQRRDGGHAEVRRLRSFDAAAVAAGLELDVPDPYYGDGAGFELVLDQCEAACRGLLAEVQARLARR